MIEIAGRMADKMVGMLSRRGFLGGLGNAAAGATGFFGAWALARPAFGKKPAKEIEVICCEYQNVYVVLIPSEDDYFCSEGGPDDTFKICFGKKCPKEIDLYEEFDCPARLVRKQPFTCNPQIFDDPGDCCRGIPCDVAPNTDVIEADDDFFP